jgi:hypothetical protein
MGHSMICAMEELARSLERQRREEGASFTDDTPDGEYLRKGAIRMAEERDRKRREAEKEKQTMTVEIVFINEVDLPPVSRVGTPAVCDNSVKGGS